MTLGRLKAGRYSSLKVGRLQNWRYHGFSASAVCLVLDDRVHARADLVHLLEVRQFHHARRALCGDRFAASLGRQQAAEIAEDVGPAVADEVFVLMATRDQDVEVVHPPLLPAGRQRLHPFGIGRTIAALIDGRGRALEDV